MSSTAAARDLELGDIHLRAALRSADSRYTAQSLQGAESSQGIATATATATAHIPSQSRLARLRLANPVPPFQHPLDGQKTGSDVVVDFDGPDDPYRPLNWQRKKKLMTIIVYALLGAGATFNSAIFSSADSQVAVAFHQSTIVTALATTMILLGFALGPLFWGPLSEIYGRKWVVIVPYFIAGCFAFACGSSETIEAILITRFFQGLFSSSVLTNTGGVLGDLFPPKERGNALIIYSLGVVGGPVLSPIVGSAVVNSYLRWRWTMWLVGIIQMTLAGVAILLIDESYVPVLLFRKAQSLRHTSGNWALHAKHEEWDISILELSRKYLMRPIQLMVNPICFLMSLYASFAYGLIYGSLTAIPIVFQTKRGWSPVVASLPFIALLIGCVAGLVGNSLNQKFYARALARNDGKPVPEARLYPMMPGSFLLASGLFIFGWTSTLDVVWVVPCIGIMLIGAGFFPIFQASLNYIVDTFLPVAASAVATVTFMRSIVASAFPLFTGPMLQNLGTNWGLSLLGFIGVAMVPVPFVFYKFGKQLREMRQISSIGM